MRGAAILLLFTITADASAGLHYSQEPFAEFPTQWRGLLIDQRLLRTLAVPSSTHPLRPAYEQAAKELQAKPTLTADEAADLGALLVRLGQPADAVAVLRPAQRQQPEHFRLAANLGTAWQAQGDLVQAEALLAEAVRLAPANLRPAEALHLKLVRARQRPSTGLDDLFGVKFPLDDAAKLPPDAVALAQKLALWLPADGRLLWQLGELAAALGDLRTAANIADGCVTEFGLADAELRARRPQLRAAADALLQRPGDHDAHAAGKLKARSPRPLLRRFDPAGLPAVKINGTNTLPWVLLAETSIDRETKPRFVNHLKQLDGKRVQLLGYMQPVGDGLEMASFLLIEYPVGCWFCETPEVTGLVSVELAPGKVTQLKRNLVKVEGVLKLNDRDPEDFFYSVRNATVAEAD